MATKDSSTSVTTVSSWTMLFLENFRILNSTVDTKANRQANAKFHRQYALTTTETSKLSFTKYHKSLAGANYRKYSFQSVKEGLLDQENRARISKELDTLHRADSAARVMSVTSPYYRSKKKTDTQSSKDTQKSKDTEPVIEKYCKIKPTEVTTPKPVKRTEFGQHALKPRLPFVSDPKRLDVTPEISRKHNRSEVLALAAKRRKLERGTAAVLKQSGTQDEAFEKTLQGYENKM